MSRKTFVLRSVTDELNSAKQINAAIPNIIYSLDASHLIKVVVSSLKWGYYPIITIHDWYSSK